MKKNTQNALDDRLVENETLALSKFAKFFSTSVRSHVRRDGCQNTFDIAARLYPARRRHRKGSWAFDDAVLADLTRSGFDLAYLRDDLEAQASRRIWNGDTPVAPQDNATMVPQRLVAA